MIDTLHKIIIQYIAPLTTSMEEDHEFVAKIDEELKAFFIEEKTHDLSNRVIEVITESGFDAFMIDNKLRQVVAEFGYRVIS